MGIRTNIELLVQFGLNNSLTNKTFDRDKQELLDTMDRSHVTQVALAASATAEDIGLGGVTNARLLYIEADAEVTVLLNGTEVVTLQRMVDPASTSADEVCAFALLTVAFTSLALTNPSSTDAVNVTIAIVGDIITE